VNILNVNVELNGDKVAYAAQSDWDEANGTITLYDGVNDYGLVLNTDYVLDSKELTDPVSVKYTGPNVGGDPVFLIL
jgi:hypothetical protein